MTDLLSEKIIHKFKFFLVDSLRKQFAPVFYLETFLRSPEDALFILIISAMNISSIYIQNA